MIDFATRFLYRKRVYVLLRQAKRTKKAHGVCRPGRDKLSAKQKG